MELTTGDFSGALSLLKSGKRVARLGWNGKNMFAVYSPGNSSFLVENLFTDSLKQHFRLQENVCVRPSFLLKTAQEDIAYWTPSASDILADDWYEVTN
jgi:hypothetical protein